jgi:hypothetical protein
VCAFLGNEKGQTFFDLTLSVEVAGVTTLIAQPCIIVNSEAVLNPMLFQVYTIRMALNKKLCLAIVLEIVTLGKVSSKQCKMPLNYPNDCIVDAVLAVGEPEAWN